MKDILLIIIGIIIILFITYIFTSILDFLGFYFPIILSVLVGLFFFLMITDSLPYNWNVSLYNSIGVNYKIITSLICIGLIVCCFYFKNSLRSFPDGIYCGKVKYYNPTTEKEATYLLKIKIEDDRLKQIQFNNGGVLDQSHFDSEDARIENGKISIIDDRDREFDITLISKGEECEI